MPCHERPLRLLCLTPLLAVLTLLAGLCGVAWADLPMIARAAPTAQLAVQQIAAQCETAAMLAGRAAGIPERVLPAIALVESGRRGEDGRMHPWPWSINVEGTDHIYDSRAEAIAAVRGFQAQGIRSIDVGCLQVNLMHHPHAFTSLEQAFDPMANASYAAHFLRELYAEAGSWAKAIAAYHSLTPALGDTYRRQVMAALGGVLPADTPGSTPIGGGVAASALQMPGWMAARRLSQQNAPLAGMPTAPSLGASINRGLDSYRARAVWASHPMPAPG